MTLLLGQQLNKTKKNNPNKKNPVAAPLTDEEKQLLKDLDPESSLTSETTVAQLDRIISIVRGAQQDVTANIDQLMIQVNDHSHQYDNYIQGAHKALSTIEDLLSNIINKMA